MKMKILILFLILILIISGCKDIACTEEAKICPDGSSVNRIGPNCEFKECPLPVCNLMNLSEAMEIAQNSECIQEGELKETSFCNEGTNTWWIDLGIEKQGCNPACVINTKTKEAEINWRCTGFLIDPKEECDMLGKEWKTFSNGCTDSCEYIRYPENVFCTQTLTEGCDCGIGECWNGETCEKI